MKIPKARELPSGKWWLQLRINGKSYSITRDTARECEAEAMYIKSALATKQMTANEKERLTIDELLTAYIRSRELKGRSPATIRGYLTLQRNRFQNIRDVSYSRITNWQGVVDAESALCSEKTLKNAWGLIQSAFRHAGLPVPSVSLDPPQRRELPFLTKAQLVQFLQLINGDPYEIYALFALHSLRRSEILALTWDSVDLEKRTIQISSAVVPDKNNTLTRKPETKTSASTRTIPFFIVRLHTLLTERKNEGLPIRPPACENTPTIHINRLCAQNGLPEVGLHGLRRTFASICHSQRIPERTTMRWGGWSNPATMHKFYIKLDEVEIDEQAQIVAEEFYNLLTNAYAHTGKRWKLKHC